MEGAGWSDTLGCLRSFLVPGRRNAHLIDQHQSQDSVSVIAKVTCSGRGHMEATSRLDGTAVFLDLGSGFK